MSIHCFAVPAWQPEPAQSELNQFLASHRVVALRREFVQDGASSCWAFCVEVAQGADALPDMLRADNSRGGRGGRHAGSGSNEAVDYKLLLSEEDFAVFAGLRNLRKQLAQREGVPVYAVFTNEQLAAIARRRPESPAALGEMEGIGPARVSKYGADVQAWFELHPSPSWGNP